MPTTGFEPAHQMAPPPQDGMSTNFTTWALFGAKIMKTKKDTLVNNIPKKKSDPNGVRFYPNKSLNL